MATCYPGYCQLPVIDAAVKTRLLFPLLLPSTPRQPLHRGKCFNPGSDPVNSEVCDLSITINVESDVGTIPVNFHPSLAHEGREMN